MPLRFKNPLIFASALLAIFASAALAGEPVMKTLDNGLQLAVLEDPNVPLVTVRLYVRGGSMHERGLMGSGISHLVEHLVSGGTTDKRTEAESQRLIAKLGGQANAYTSHDRTCYHITTTPENLETALDLISDWAFNAAFAQEEYDRELDVVRQEIGTRLVEPQARLYERFIQTKFRVHPFRYPIIGYEEALNQITREDVINYHEMKYVPNNMLLVVAGGVFADEVYEKTRQYFGKAKRGFQPDHSMVAEPPQLNRRDVVEYEDVSMGYKMMGFRTVPLHHPDLYALDVADYILSRGDGSRLVRRLRDEKRLVHSIGSGSYTPGWDTGVFMFQAVFQPENAEQVGKAILEELELLATEPPSADELERAKKQKIADYYGSLQTIENRGERLASDLLHAYDPAFSRLYVDRIQEVTPDEVRDAARRYFREESLTSVTFLPRETEEQIEVQAKDQELERVEEEIRIVTLDNGLRLLIGRNPASPLVSLHTYSLAGVRCEDEEDNGVGNLVGALLTRGTATRSAVEIAETLDAMGASLSASSGNNTFYVRGACLGEDIDEFMELYADVIRNPSFDEDEFERRRDLVLAGLRRERDDLYGSGMRFLRSKYYEDAPYGLMPQGTEESVAALTRRNLLDFHANHIVPDNMVMAIFGDIDPDDIERQVRERFGDMEKRDEIDMPAPATPRRLEENELYRKTVDQDKALVMIAWPGMTLQDVDDRAAMRLATAVLSGIRIPRGRIHDELRGKGLVYASHGINWVGIDPGLFIVYAVTEPHQVDEVVDIIQSHLQRLKEELVEQEELEIARANATIAEARDMQTNSDRASDAALNELYSLGHDFSPRFMEKLENITAEDVREVARKYFNESVIVVLEPEQAAPGAEPLPEPLDQP